MCRGPKTSKDSLVLFLSELVGLKSKMSNKSAKEKAMECERCFKKDDLKIKIYLKEQLSLKFVSGSFLGDSTRRS